MDTLCLKNRLLILFFCVGLSIISCNVDYKARPVRTDEFLPNLEFENYQEEEIFSAKVFLKKGALISDSGRIVRMSYAKNAEDAKIFFFYKFEFVKVDTIHVNDTIEIFIKDKKYQLYNIEEKIRKGVSHGNPFYREYKSGGKIYYIGDRFTIR
jgi:hypothetical protein